MNLTTISDENDKHQAYSHELYPIEGSNNIISNNAFLSSSTDPATVIDCHNTHNQNGQKVIDNNKNVNCTPNTNAINNIDYQERPSSLFSPVNINERREGPHRIFRRLINRNVNFSTATTEYCHKDQQVLNENNSQQQQKQIELFTSGYHNRSMGSGIIDKGMKSDNGQSGSKLLSSIHPSGKRLGVQQKAVFSRKNIAIYGADVIPGQQFTDQINSMYCYNTNNSVLLCPPMKETISRKSIALTNEPHQSLTSLNNENSPKNEKFMELPTNFLNNSSGTLNPLFATTVDIKAGGITAAVNNYDATTRNIRLSCITSDEWEYNEDTGNSVHNTSDIVPSSYSQYKKSSSLLRDTLPRNEHSVYCRYENSEAINKAINKETATITTLSSWMATGISKQYEPSTGWFSSVRYYPIKVTDGPLEQQAQRMALRGEVPMSVLIAGKKKKKKNSVVVGDESPITKETPLETPRSGSGGSDKKIKKKKSKMTNPPTSLLNGRIGLRRIPTTEGSSPLDTIFAKYSVSLLPKDVPLNSSQPHPISNISSIHRGLSPYICNVTGTILLDKVINFILELVPPENMEIAFVEYIRPFAIKIEEDALSADPGAKEECPIVSPNNNKSNFISLADNASIENIDSTTRLSINRTPSDRFGRTLNSTYSYIRTPSTQIVTPIEKLGARLTTDRLNHENLFKCTRVPYEYVIKAFNGLLAPPVPLVERDISNNNDSEVDDTTKSIEYNDDNSEAYISARLCFDLVDEEKRGYILRDNVLAKSTSTYSPDYNYKVTNGLLRAFEVMAKLEEERFIAIAKKKKKRSKRKKINPAEILPKHRQFHISLDEFSYIMCTDPYVAVSFLPYLVKTLISGERDLAAKKVRKFYGKSQVAYSAIQKQNQREKEIGAHYLSLAHA